MSAGMSGAADLGRVGNAGGRSCSVLLRLLGSFERKKREGMKRSWDMKDGVIPDGLRSELEEIANRKTPFDTEGLPVPPWQAFPHLERRSMGWRMGAGEDYLLGFYEWFSGLDKAEKTRYARLHPEPDEWAGFYSLQGGFDSV